MNKYVWRGLVAAFVALLAIPLATPASAQATRTWISGVGDDANPCSRTAPCKTFAGAISKTAAGGEINCLDPGGFGAVTITKSISLICEGVLDGILLTSGNGINIVVGANDVVLLSGFDIQGLGLGTNGIRFTSGVGLHLRNSTIRGFRGSGGYGINFAPTSPAATLVVDNVTIVDNGATSGTTGGILVQPAANVAATVAITNIRLTDNNRGGIRFDAANAGSSIKATVSNSVIADNQIGVYARSAAGGGTANVVLIDSVVSGNSSSGLLAEGANATINATGNSIAQNSNGVRALTGGNLVSFGDNVLVGNNNNGAFTATVRQAVSLGRGAGAMRTGSAFPMASLWGESP